MHVWGYREGFSFSGQSLNVFLPFKCGLSSGAGCFECLVCRMNFISVPSESREKKCTAVSSEAGCFN